MERERVWGEKEGRSVSGGKERRRCVSRGEREIEECE